MSINKKGSISVLALCVISFLGLKDTGIFVSDHVQPTYSGNKVYFEVGETANIIDSSDRGYIVQKGKAQVTVPYEKVQLTEKITKTFKVVKNATIKNDKDEIVRNLFIGEKLVQVSEKEKSIKAKCEDGTVGIVSVEALELISEEKQTFDVEVPKKEIILTSVENNKETSINMSYVEKEETKAVEYSSEKAKTAVQSALDKLGATYVYGDTGKEGYDCSGLVYAVYKNQLGVNLPRSSREQSGYGKQVSKSELQPGDLVFFNTSGNGVSHVGIYMGNDEFVHASSGQSKVVVSKLSEDYYRDRYTNATRVL
ncbi:MAG: C40 family peptidase [Peptoniphilus sp.]|nr:C40 family peptidase [Peptoniphilus sp.]